MQRSFIALFHWTQMTPHIHWSQPHQDVLPKGQRYSFKLGFLCITSLHLSKARPNPNPRPTVWRMPLRNDGTGSHLSIPKGEIHPTVTRFISFPSPTPPHNAPQLKPLSASTWSFHIYSSGCHSPLPWCGALDEPKRGVIPKDGQSQFYGVRNRIWGRRSIMNHRSVSTMTGIFIFHPDLKIL